VVFDGAPAHEQPGRYVGIGQTIAGESRDLDLAGGEPEEDVGDVFG
jgi:hypothetical protein